MDKTKIFLIAIAFVLIISIAIIIGSIYFLIDLTEDTNTFSDLCLEDHNDYRSKHKDTDPLTVSHDLVRTAEKRAKVLSESDPMDSTNSNKNKPIKGRIGENMWSLSTSESEERYKTLTCEEAVDSWYSEQKFYIYGIPWPSIPLTKHFTQVVWKSTKQLGCAKSFNKKNVYVVCHYTPKGNAFSQYKQNVMNRNGKFVDI